MRSMHRPVAMGSWPWDGDLGKWVKVRVANTHKTAQICGYDVPDLCAYLTAAYFPREIGYSDRES